MNIQELLSITTFIIMLPVLAAGIFIAFMHKREFMEKAGFGKPEVGMILVGSMFGLFADIPLIISERSLLNINLGGALIPIIVSASLIYKKRLDLLRVVAGVAGVSAVAFYVTRFEPELGIVAEFPDFLAPSALAIGLALVLESKGYRRIPFAYSVAVLGNLIGADIVRIPMLMDEGILGSIGGAGAQDLVYLSGLIASIPLVTLYYFKYPFSEAEDPLNESLKMLRLGRYTDSLRYSKEAVRGELRKASRIIPHRRRGFEPSKPTDIEIFQNLGLHSYIIEDYKRLMVQKENTSSSQAHKAFLTARLLKNSIQEKINSLYTSLSRRIIAYIIDVLLITVPPLIGIFYIYTNYFFMIEIGDYTMNIFIALVSLAISIQFIYFTLTEWFFGTTIGKFALGLKVTSDDFTDISFTQSAARNSARYADIALFFYIFSIALILSNPRRKRIGDYVGGTRVVKTK